MFSFNLCPLSSNACSCPLTFGFVRCRYAKPNGASVQMKRLNVSRLSRGLVYIPQKRS